MSDVKKLSLPDKIRALACALSILRDEAGGFSTYEKDNSVIVLQGMYDELVTELNT